MKNDDNKSKSDLSEYRMGRFTVLQLMSLLAILGVVAAVLAKWWLGA